MSDDPRGWTKRAACASTEDQSIFFPPLGSKVQQYYYSDGRQVCRYCPVWQACLDAADSWGMWGGLTPRERSGKRLVDHGSWIRYRQGCRCDVCTESHVDECSAPRPGLRRTG